MDIKAAKGARIEILRLKKSEPSSFDSIARLSRCFQAKHAEDSLGC
jgi:hypothetical protein